jgi:hypothetical protein
MPLFLKERDGHFSLRHVASARKDRAPQRDGAPSLQQRQPHLGFLPLPKHPFSEPMHKYLLTPHQRVPFARARAAAQLNQSGYTNIIQTL